MRRLAPRMALLMTLITLPALVVAPAHAVEPNERLADPALEARARTISAQLRCLVCQNESIDESNASLAHDIRIFVRERLVAGETNPQVVQDVVSRYGTFVLLNPPVRPATYVLWYGPPALLAIAAAGSLVWLRRGRLNVAPPSALSEVERQRLHELLQDAPRTSQRNVEQ
jgi:cytochrome c-type biogenesis protein CcmH